MPNTISWTTAAFDHATTGWALTGSHQDGAGRESRGCADCHVGNNYTFTAANTDCYGLPRRRLAKPTTMVEWYQITSRRASRPLNARLPQHDYLDFHFQPRDQRVSVDRFATNAPRVNLRPARLATLNNNYTLTIAPRPTRGQLRMPLTTCSQTNMPTHASAGAPFAAANWLTCHNTITWNTAPRSQHHGLGINWGAPNGASGQSCGLHRLPRGQPLHLHGGETRIATAATSPLGKAPTTMVEWYQITVAAGFPDLSMLDLPHQRLLDFHFNNHATTGFPLTNSHQWRPRVNSATCAASTSTINYTLTTRDDCRQLRMPLDHLATTNNPAPSQPETPFAQRSCSTCHNTITLDTAIFDHSTTGWALTGFAPACAAGKVVACAGLPQGQQLHLTVANTDCYGCTKTCRLSSKPLAGAVPNHSRRASRLHSARPCHDRYSGRLARFDHSTTGWRCRVRTQLTALRFCHMGVPPHSALLRRTRICYGMPSGGLAEHANARRAKWPKQYCREVPTTCLSWPHHLVHHRLLGPALSALSTAGPHSGTMARWLRTATRFGLTTRSLLALCAIRYQLPHRPGMSHPNVNGGNWSADVFVTTV